MQPQELTARIVEMGAYKAALLDVSLIHFDRKFRELCESNACGNYGACWTCPPDAGDIDTLIARAKTYQKALVYQTVGRLEDSFDIEGMLEAGQAPQRPGPGHLPLGPGGRGLRGGLAAPGGRRLPAVPGVRQAHQRALPPPPRTPWPLWRPTAWPCPSWPPPAA